MLNQRIRTCTECGLSGARRHSLPREGNLHARVMLIALSPGKTEDKENRMFVRPSGQVLNEIFDSVSLQRELFYMTNLIKCTLPKNRKPKDREIKSFCRFRIRHLFYTILRFSRRQ